MKGCKGVDATFYDMEQCLTYRRVYASKRGFLSALSRMSSTIAFRNAVDHKRMIVIRPNNMDEYRRMK